MKIILALLYLIFNIINDIKKASTFYPLQIHLQ